MQIIVMPLVTLRLDGERLEVVHNRTGLVAESTVKKLSAWAVAQLRKELLPAPVRANL